MSEDNMFKRPIVARVGGKSKLAETIVNLIPSHDTYVEAFAGGASVFFKKPKNISKLEVLNDKDKDIANIYKDIKKIDSLSDKEFQPNRTKFNKLKFTNKFNNEKDRLYRNLYLSLTSFRGDRSHYIGENLETDKRYKNVGVKFKDQNIYDKIRNRLKGVKIFSDDYKKIIRQFDSPTTFFYLDPPYSRAEKSKDYQEVGVDIFEVCRFLTTIKGKFILSYDDVADARKICNKFKIRKIRTKYESTKTGAYDVDELLITNF